MKKLEDLKNDTFFINKIRNLEYYYAYPGTESDKIIMCRRMADLILRYLSFPDFNYDLKSILAISELDILNLIKYNNIYDNYDSIANTIYNHIQEHVLKAISEEESVESKT